MSAPRRRRWIEVLRRTAGVAGEDDGERGSSGTLDDAALWGAHEHAAKSLAEASVRSERLAASAARMRPMVEGASERAGLVSARSEGLGSGAARVRESFERLGVVALNAGLEGARMSEPHGRALQLLSDEIRANVARGADAAEQLTRAVDEVAAEAADVRQKLERARVETAEVGQEAAHLQAAAQQATKALDDLGARLRKATGIDPEMARLVSSASEHARGLMTALSGLATAAPGAPVLAALRPVIGPLSRLLGEIDARAPGEDGQGGAEGGT
ncbi:methyl-accepting chemotaxis protein III (MCP-III) [Minicystis rosea]|nr:methyl-accepting chemotaxis protein III (MCP-III) [Minicystis rosea]